MKSLKSNPLGLYRKYAVRQLVPNPLHDPMGIDEETLREYVEEPGVPGAEYFVLRLDKGANPTHRAASRAAIAVYATIAKSFNPQLAQDIEEKWIKSKDPVPTTPYERTIQSVAEDMAAKKYNKRWESAPPSIYYGRFERLSLDMQRTYIELEVENAQSSINNTARLISGMLTTMGVADTEIDRILLERGLIPGKEVSNE